MKKWLEKQLGVPSNWDKYDYQTQRYSFKDIEDVLNLYQRHVELECEHPYAYVIGEEHGNPRCLKCNKIL
jgi:hypothetical protein